MLFPNNERTEGRDMGILLSDEEKKSLKRDLVGPVKSFLREVGDDTVGDAKKFYTAKARETEKSVRRAQEQTRESSPRSSGSRRSSKSTARP